MVKPIDAIQARLELSASLIPWLVFLFPKFSADHAPQVQRGMEEHIDIIINKQLHLKATQNHYFTKMQTKWFCIVWIIFLFETQNLSQIALKPTL